MSLVAKFLLPAIFLSLNACPPAQSATAARHISATQVVANWRQAVHAGRAPKNFTALLTTTSTEDGIAGHIEERLTSSGEYRRGVKREFDEQQILVTPHLAQRRDWNGFVRNLQGEELSRLRSAVFEAEVIVLGPPKLMAHATLSQSDDQQAYSLTMTPSGGKPITWSISRKSWLPLKSVRPGEDSEITTTYSDWRAAADGILTPHHALVSETHKPDYTWQRTAVHLTSRIASMGFAPLLPGPLDAHLDPNAPPIPFNFESSHILFKVSVNGREPIWFILDTGADQEVLNSTRLPDFGIKPYAKSATTGGGGTAEYDYVEGATFTLPGVELRHQHVAAMDETGLENALGLPLGGILGYDFISRFILDIDYQKKRIILHDPKTWTYSGKGVSVPIVFDLGIPFTHGVISVAGREIPAYFVLDFGAAETMTLTSPFVKANNLQKLALSNATVNRPAGLEKQFFAQNNVRGHLDQLTVDKLIVRSIPINMSVNTQGAYASKTFSGTIGEGIYHRYHAILDYAHQRVIFEPTAEADEPFPDRLTYGLALIAWGPDLHTYTVTAVRAGSPAAADGFQKGDVIAAMDNAPAAQFTLGELREHLAHAGNHLNLEVIRGGAHLNMPIQVRLVSLDRQ